MKSLQAVLFPLPPGLRPAHHAPGGDATGLRQEVIPPTPVRPVMPERKDGPRFEVRRDEARFAQPRMKAPPQPGATPAGTPIFAEETEGADDFRPRVQVDHEALAAAASPRVRAAISAYHTAFVAGLPQLGPGEYFDLAV